jgi:CheY-like chemotaxis protein
MSSSPDPDHLPEHGSLGPAVLDLVRHGGPEVLTVGCAPTEIPVALARHLDKEVTCVEADGEALQLAAEAGVQHELEVATHSPEWSESLAGQRFDVIVLSIPAPDDGCLPEALQRLRQNELLQPTGHLVVISRRERAGEPDVPDPVGELRRALEASGFAATHVLRPDGDARGPLVLRAAPLEALASDGLREEVERLRQQVARAERRRRRAVRERDDAQRRAGELESELEAVRTSRTWRAGRLLTGGPGAIKRRLRRRG